MASPTFVDFGPFLLRRLIYHSQILDLWYSALRRDGLEVPCLVRRMLPPYTQGPEYVSMMRDRAAEVQSFHHPGVLRPLTFDVLDGIPYVVLELVRGWNLGALLHGFLEARRPVPPEVIVQLAFPVAHALATGHSRPNAPLVHGALRPSSIWVGADGATRLGDLEIGPLADRELNSVSADDSWRYQAPERSRPWMGPAPAVDVFSLGAILLELLVAGRLNEVQIKSGVPDRLRLLQAQGILPALLQLIGACHAAPEARPPMAAVVEGLRHLSGLLPRTPVGAWLSAYAPPIDPLAQAGGAESLLAGMLPLMGSGAFPQDGEHTIMAPDRAPVAPVKSPATSAARSTRAIGRRVAVGLAAAVALAGAGWALRAPLGSLLPRRTVERVVVSIDSSPPGAVIEKDGEVLGEAPVRKVVRVDPDGRVALLARKEGWMTQGPIRLEAPSDGELAYRFVLDPRVEGLAAARIVTDPPGAKLTVDGTARGEAPVTVGELHSAREHTVTATLSGYGPATRTFRVEVGRITDVSLELKKQAAPVKVARPAPAGERGETGALLLEASSPAQILIDGQPRGKTGSSRKLTLPAGSHSIELYDPVRNMAGTYEVVVVPGETQQLEYDFASGVWRVRAVQPAGDTP